MAGRSAGEASSGNGLSRGRESHRNVKEGEARGKKQTGEQRFVNLLSKEEEKFEDVKQKRRNRDEEDQQFDVYCEEHERSRSKRRRFEVKYLSAASGVL